MTAETSTITAAEARRAARNAGAIAAASIVSRGVQFAWQLILYPALGVAASGLYGTVGAFLMIGATLPYFGMGPIVIRDVARHPDRAGRYLSATLVIQTLLALVAYVGVNAAASLGGYDESIRVFVAVAGISLMVDIFGNMCNDLLLAQERMLASSLVAIGHVTALVVFAWIGLAAGYGLFGVYVGTLLAGAGRSAALWLLLVRGGVRPAWPLDRTLARGLLINGAPLALTSFLALAYQHADKLLTTRFIGEVGTGYLSVAFLIHFGVIEVLNTTVVTAMYPLISRSYGEGCNPLFGFMVEKLTFFTMLVCLPVVLALSIYATDIITFIFRGDKFAPAGDVLRVLIWYTFLSMSGNLFAQGMLAQNRQRLLLAIRAFGLGLNLALLAVLLPAMGVRGAPFASLCAEFVVFALLFTRFTSVGWGRWRLASRAARLLLPGVAAGLVMLTLHQFFFGVGIAAGFVVYAVVVLVGQVLGSEDWDLLYRLAAAAPGGRLILRRWRRDVKLNW
jgi:O-antigen/teichoic acid export membrane protein